LGGLGPLVWEEIENEQTVHKGLAKLLYRLFYKKVRNYSLFDKFLNPYLNPSPNPTPTVQYYSIEYNKHNNALICQTLTGQVVWQVMGRKRTRWPGCGNGDA
jgi:hypothetical protein